MSLTSCDRFQESNHSIAPSPSPSNRPAIVATTSVLCDLTRQIAQETIALTCLLDAGQDPHAYKVTPSDRRAIETADLVLYGGYSLEPDLIRIIQATQTPAPKVAVYELAVPHPLEGTAHDHAAHDHAEESEMSPHSVADQIHNDSDQHPDHQDGSAVDSTHDAAVDPHVWHNALNGIAIAETIEQSLSNLIPAQATRYTQNTATLRQDLTQLHAWIQAQVATIPPQSRILITPHNAFRYFADAYGLTIGGTLGGLNSESGVSAVHVAELVETVRSAQVPAIFAEATTNRQLMTTIAHEAGVTVPDAVLYVEGPAGSDSPAPTYQAMLRHNTCTIVTALGGRCQSQ